LKTLWLLTDTSYSIHRDDCATCPFCGATKSEIRKSNDTPTVFRTFLDNVFSIPTEDIVFCMLHARIRITGKLLERTLLWAADNGGATRLTDLIKAEANLDLNATRSKDRKKMEFVNMTGDRCRRLLDKAEDIFQAWIQRGGCKKIALIWEKWATVNKRLSKPEIHSESIPKLRQCIDDWVGLVKEMWHEEAITPYIHIIHKHAVDIVVRHGSISKFSQQGFEACHRWHRILYNSCTNHGGYRKDPKFKIDSVHMLLTRIYRLEFLELFFKDENSKEFVSNLLCM